MFTGNIREATTQTHNSEPVSQSTNPLGFGEPRRPGYILEKNALVPVHLLFYCFPDRLCHTGLNHDLLVFLMLGVEI